jgi:NMD protein affecting ribosome stability and mRNA decay
MPDGLVIKPDGVNELDPCLYQTEQVFTNCTVEVSRCKKCGAYNISWYRTPWTKEVPEEQWETALLPYFPEEEEE